MFTIETRTVIDAPSYVIWQVLVQFSKYNEWNTIMTPIDTDRPQLGHNLKLEFSMPDVPPYTVEPEIITLDTHRHLAWRNETLMSGLFDEEHHFVLKIMEDKSQTELHNYEECSGLLSNYMKGKSRVQAAPASFETMNAELKARAEAVHQASSA